MWTYQNNTYKTLSDCTESILNSLLETENCITVTYFQAENPFQQTTRLLYFILKDGKLQYDWIFTEIEMTKCKWVIRFGSTYEVIGCV